MASELLEGAALVGAAASRRREPPRRGSPPPRRRWTATSPTANRVRGRARRRPQLALMAAADERPIAVESGPARVACRTAARAVRRVVRDVPSIVHAGPVAKRDVCRSGRTAAGHRRHGLRRAVSAADPSHRPDEPQGDGTTRSPPAPATQAAPGRSVASRAVTPRSNRGSARSTTSRPSGSAAERDGLEVALDLAYQCSPDHPWVTRAPRVVQASARRLDQVRREPAEAVSGHLPASISTPTRGTSLWDALRRRHPLLGRARRAHLSRGQPAHQELPLLGVGDCRGPAALPRRDLPVGGVHPAEGDAVTWPSSGSRSPTHTSPGATRRPSSRSISPS